MYVCMPVCTSNLYRVCLGLWIHFCVCVCSRYLWSVCDGEEVECPRRCAGHVARRRHQRVIHHHTPDNPHTHKARIHQIKMIMARMCVCIYTTDGPDIPKAFHQALVPEIVWWGVVLVFVLEEGEQLIEGRGLAHCTPHTRTFVASRRQQQETNRNRPY